MATVNYDLYTNSDDKTKFKEWREKIAGDTDSNMTRIDNVLAGKQDELTGEAGQVVGFNADGKAVAMKVPESGVPNKVLTQSEYDALTDEEKQADVVYLVPDGIDDESQKENNIFFVEFYASEDWSDPSQNTCSKTLTEIFDAIDNKKMIVGRLRLSIDDQRVCTFHTSVICSDYMEGDHQQIVFFFYSAGMFSEPSTILYDETGVYINI